MNKALQLLYIKLMDLYIKLMEQVWLTCTKAPAPHCAGINPGSGSGRSTNIFSLLCLARLICAMHFQTAPQIR